MKENCLSCDKRLECLGSACEECARQEECEPASLNDTCCKCAILEACEGTIASTCYKVITAPLVSIQ